MRTRGTITIRLGAAVFLLTAIAAKLSGQSGSTFIAVTPCRVVDTRNAAGPFGGPMLTNGNNIRTFPIPSGPCGIPRSATGYSFNITVVPGGQLGYVELWPTGQNQPVAANLVFFPAEIISNAAIVPAGVGGSVNAFVNADTHIILDINGYFVSPTAAGQQDTALGDGTSMAGSQNTAIGFGVLAANVASGNTGTGAGTLTTNSTGNNNSAFGAAALTLNSTGGANTAVGSQALSSNTVGNDNTAVGVHALFSNIQGNNNTVVGQSAGSSNMIGSNNVAVGQGALQSNDGSFNIAIGAGAGNLVTSGNNNVFIGNAGASSDSNVIRIGTNQVFTYIAGIANESVSNSAQVVIDLSSGQLGTVRSSGRYKEDINDIGSRSDGLSLLRPVSFRYKAPAADGSKPIHYGLIAEEVDKVFPELVVHGADGRVETVAYQEVPALLLNELIKQQKLVKELQSRIEQLEQSTNSNRD